MDEDSPIEQEPVEVQSASSNPEKRSRFKKILKKVISPILAGSLLAGAAWKGWEDGAQKDPGFTPLELTQDDDNSSTTTSLADDLTQSASSTTTDDINQAADEPVAQKTVECEPNYADVYTKYSLAELNESVKNIEFFFNDPAMINQFRDVVNQSTDLTELRYVFSNAFAARQVNIHFNEAFTKDSGIVLPQQSFDLATTKIVFQNIITAYSFMPLHVAQTAKDVFLMDGLQFDTGSKTSDGQPVIGAAGGLAYIDHVYLDNGWMSDAHTGALSALELFGHELMGHVLEGTICHDPSNQSIADPIMDKLNSQTKTTADIEGVAGVAENYQEDFALSAAAIFSKGELPIDSTQPDSQLLKDKKALVIAETEKLEPSYAKYLQWLKIYGPTMRSSGDTPIVPAQFRQLNVAPFTVINPYEVDQSGSKSKLDSIDIKMPDGAMQKVYFQMNEDNHTVYLYLKEVPELGIVHGKDNSSLEVIAKGTLDQIVHVKGYNNYKTFWLDFRSLPELTPDNQNNKLPHQQLHQFAIGATLLK